MPRVYLGLGSNLDPMRNIESGVEELRGLGGLLGQSSIYRSAAVGFQGPAFLNMVISIDITSSLFELAKSLKKIEYRYGREIDAPKCSSRELDIDILVYGDYVGVYGDIFLPRPEIYYNSHVLCPFAEIAPDLILPGCTKRLKCLWHEFDQSRQPLERIEASVGEYLQGQAEVCKQKLG